MCSTAPRVILDGCLCKSADSHISSSLLNYVNYTARAVSIRGEAEVSFPVSIKRALCSLAAGVH
jgi:hypothetical protein